MYSTVVQASQPATIFLRALLPATKCRCYTLLRGAVGFQIQTALLRQTHQKIRAVEIPILNPGSSSLQAASNLITVNNPDKDTPAS